MKSVVPACHPACLVSQVNMRPGLRLNLAVHLHFLALYQLAGAAVAQRRRVFSQLNFKARLQRLPTYGPRVVLCAWPGRRRRAGGSNLRGKRHLPSVAKASWDRVRTV